MVKLTASFVLYRTPLDEVERAIDQVRASASDARIVLIDNSPDPNPLPAINDSLVEIIRPGRNLGYGAGHNLAFRLSAGDQYHAVMNTDLVYGPEVFPRLLRFMDDHLDVGLSMPRVCYPDGSIQHLCRLLPEPFDIFARGFMKKSQWTKKRNNRYEFRWWSYDQIAEFPFLSGCFMLLRRQVIDEVGGFDERYFMYGEDVDLSRRIYLAHRTVYFPDVTIMHEYRSQVFSWRQTITKIINLVKYFNKWGWIYDKERSAANKQTLLAVDGSKQTKNIELRIKRR